MNKRKLIILLLGLLIGTNVYAQRDKIEHLSNFDKDILHYGYYVGLNYLDYKIAYKAPDEFPDAYIETQPRLGFNIGLIGELRINDNINLRLEPGLMSNKKKLLFHHLDNAADSVRYANSAFLHVPLLVQLNANRIHNVRPYVAAGLAYDLNFASNFNNPDDNSGGEFRMQKHNLMYELAVGMDFYFFYFKFSPSIRGVFAINDEILPDDDPNSQWTAPVDYMGTRGIFFRMTFQ